MRIPSVISLLGAAIILAGCASSQPVEIGLIDSPDVYNDRMLDALSPQRYTEQQMIYMRKIDEYEHELRQIEDKRQALEQRLALNMLEAQDGSITAHDDEAVRMSEYANATYETQSRLAQENAERAAQQALIENERDRQLLEAELEANRKLAALALSGGLDEQTAAAKQRIEAEAARERAKIEQEAELEIRAVEREYQERINLTQSNESAAREADNSHKINLALTTAQTERRMREEIAEVDSEIQSLSSSRDAEVAAIQDQIDSLQSEIRKLELQAQSVRDKFGSLIAAETGKLRQLELEAQTLSEMSKSLLADQGTRTGSSQSIESLERELEKEIQRVRSSLEQRQKAIDKNVDQQLRALGIASADDPNGAGLTKLKENEILAELASAKLRINNEARSEIATLNVRTEIAKAQVVAPVVTSRAVYASDYSENPKPLALNAVSNREQRVARASPPKPAVGAVTPPKRNNPKPETTKPGEEESVEPIMVVASFEPQHNRPERQNVTDSVVSVGTLNGGNVQPLMIAPNATSLSVVYRFKEKASADKYSRFLSAWGESGFQQTYSDSLGEHILLMGKFTDRHAAAARADALHKLTSTAPEVVEKDL